MPEIKIDKIEEPPVHRDLEIVFDIVRELNDRINHFDPNTAITSTEDIPSIAEVKPTPPSIPERKAS